jgi:YVTN family beta-propeller protein
MARAPGFGENRPVKFPRPGLLLPLLCVAAAAPRLPGPLPDGRTRLHDGWSISPVGKSVAVGTLPLAIEPLPDGRAAVLLCGFAENGVDLVDFRSGARQRLIVPKAWLGLAASADGRILYVSGAADNVVRVFRLSGSEWTEAPPIRIAPKGARAFVAGLALDEERRRLYVCENLADRLAVVDLDRGAVRSEIPTGHDPYAVAVSPDGKTAWVSNWGDATVSDLRTDSSAPARRIEVGSHPTALRIDRDAHRLFVACPQDDVVSVVDLKTGRTAWNVSVTLSPSDREGTTPTSLALSRDGRKLYVANSDNNDVAVLDLSGDAPRVAGFLPVGRYPTAVALDADGGLLVADGKGSRPFSNPDGPQPDRPPSAAKHPNYVLRRLEGDVRRISPEELTRLPDDTRAVLADRPSPPAPSLVPAYSRIHHVIYVLKENRTYDQVLGDDPRGNGDPSLVLFGEKVTPNHHALARRFGLLDNFYCNAEVSADGHNWAMAAFANDYVEKTYPQTYSDRGRDYDYSGQRRIAYPRAGFLWDAAARAGLSYRVYGEFINNGKSPGDPSWTKIPALVGHFDPLYRGFDVSFRDVDRIAEWEREFRRFEKDGDLPALEILHLPNDHTAATRAGFRTPSAMVADNDLALGRLVDVVSHSRYFPDTAVFAVEDDAQNGPDHVDCHRSVLLVVSPFTPRGRVDSRMYSTASVVGTVEKILGLPPLSQYDERAPLLDFEFSGSLDLTPYTVRPAEVPLDALNTRDAPLARRSSTIDLEREDAAPEAILNDALYLAVQGRRAPAPRVRFGVAGTSRDED